MVLESRSIALVIWLWKQGLSLPFTHKLLRTPHQGNIVWEVHNSDQGSFTLIQQKNENFGNYPKYTKWIFSCEETEEIQPISAEYHTTPHTDKNNFQFSSCWVLDLLRFHLWCHLLCISEFAVLFYLVLGDPSVGSCVLFNSYQLQFQLGNSKGKFFWM